MNLIIKLWFTLEQLQGSYITLKCKNRFIHNLAEIFASL